jgi:hypothetical protein
VFLHTAKGACGRVSHIGITEQVESFVLPPRHTADHFLNQTSETRQTHSRAICAVAVRSAAVDDGERLQEIAGKIAFIDSCVRVINYFYFPGG